MIGYNSPVFRHQHCRDAYHHLQIDGIVIARNQRRSVALKETSLVLVVAAIRAGRQQHPYMKPCYISGYGLMVRTTITPVLYTLAACGYHMRAWTNG